MPTKTSSPRDAILNVRLPRALKSALGKAADDDHGRSLSGMVVRILEEWLDAHGYVGRARKR